MNHMDKTLIDSWDDTNILNIKPFWERCLYVLSNS